MKLVRNRQWLIPYDDDAMKTLIACNIRLTKFDYDFLPVLTQIVNTKFKDETIEVVDWTKNIWEPMLDRLEAFWSDKGCKCRFNKNEVKLTAPAEERYIKRLTLIEQKLRFFFERWGYSVAFNPAESKTRCGLGIYYSFDRERLPVITIADASYDPDFDPAILEFGDYRLVLSCRTDCFGWSFEHRDIASQWQILYQNTKVPYDKLKTSHFFSTVFSMFNLQSMHER